MVTITNDHSILATMCYINYLHRNTSSNTPATIQYTALQQTK